MAKKEFLEEEPKSNKSKTPIAKKTIKVNVGKEYQLEQGKAIPSEIPEAFYNSFRAEEII